MRFSRGIIAGLAVTALTASVAWIARAATPKDAVFRAPQAAQSTATRVIGTIKAIVGNTITLTSDAGVSASVVVDDSTKFVRVAPGQTTLQGATAIHLQDLQVGDRILVRGQAGSAGAPMNASSVIAMTRTDLQAKHAAEEQGWQRGVGGLVKGVDPTTGTISITMAAMSGTKTVAIHTTKDTILRRYAPDSVQFDKAKPEPIDQIHPGDQLRARGTRSADGNDFNAEEIVSGSFRNIAGMITAIDKSANTVSVKDLISKKEFLVKFTPQSEIRQLAPQMAQFIAMRLKNAQSGDQQGAAGSGATGADRGASGASGEEGQRAGRFQRGGGGDLQQMLNRLPPVTLVELQKDEAVMIVSTEGAVPGQVTAITLLGGVEPILEAPSGAQAMTLSPWSLGAPAEGGGGDQP